MQRHLLVKCNTKFSYLEFQMFAKQKTYRSWFKTKNGCVKSILSIRDPSSPTSVYLSRHNIHVIKWTRPSPPLYLHTASDQKLDGGKAREQGCCDTTTSTSVTRKQWDSTQTNVQSPLSPITGVLWSTTCLCSAVRALNHTQYVVNQKCGVA